MSEAVDSGLVPLLVPSACPPGAADRSSPRAIAACYGYGTGCAVARLAGCGALDASGALYAPEAPTVLLRVTHPRTVAARATGGAPRSARPASPAPGHPRAGAANLCRCRR